MYFHFMSESSKCICHWSLVFISFHFVPFHFPFTAFFFFPFAIFALLSFQSFFAVFVGGCCRSDDSFHFVLTSIFRLLNCEKWKQWLNDSRHLCLLHLSSVLLRLSILIRLINLILLSQFDRNVYVFFFFGGRRCRRLYSIRRFHFPFEENWKWIRPITFPVEMESTKFNFELCFFFRLWFWNYFHYFSTLLCAFRCFIIFHFSENVFTRFSWYFMVARSDSILTCFFKILKNVLLYCLWHPIVF